MKPELPIQLLNALEGVKGFERSEFIAVHADSKPLTSIRFNSVKNPLTHSPAPVSGPVNWCTTGVHLTHRPSFTGDPHFHAGAYYVQEASSMFLEQALRQTVDLSSRLRVLDLCAAPGGKSTLIQSLISHDSLLVSNEVIKPRVSVLIENLTKWGAENVVVSNNDPSHFARLPDFFDAMIVDAPCSGSGLFRRDPEAIEEWSEANVNLCSQRQQRILADAWPALKTNGVLIYSTCSYSIEEDEEILDWLAETTAAETIKLAIPESSGIVMVRSKQHEFYGYRFYPDKVAGEGFFIAAIRKKEDAHQSRPAPKKQKVGIARVNTQLAASIIKESDHYLFMQGEDIVAIPSALQEDLTLLQTALYIRKAGVTVGRPGIKDIIPDHALAMSGLLRNDVPRISVDREQAIRYLRRDELSIGQNMTGWAIVDFEGLALGWVKVLPNRINNYYPKEWRILQRF